VADDNRKDRYETGYGKPPRHTQFQKGQSGNSRGRPRGAKNVATIIREALRESVMINENGRRTKAPKLEVIFKQLINKAAKGDLRSIQLLIALLDKYPLTDRESTTMTSVELSERHKLLGDAVQILADLGVPAAAEALDEANKLRIAAGKKGPNSR
jgi:hypothetical protein